MSNGKQRIIATVSLLVGIALIAGSSVLFLACQMAPKRDNYNSDIAYMMSDCMYRAGDNTLVCQELVKSYANYAKEQQQYNKVIFCNDVKNYLPHWDEDSEKCLLYLNQK